jgi:V8-like Glu-specific endopeptidase
MRKTWTKKTLIASLGVGLALVSNLAQAAIYDRKGNKIPDEAVNSPEVNWELLSTEQGKSYNGIGLFEKEDEGFCTAFFLNTNGDENAPAYAVTNGHCAVIPTFPEAEEIITNHPSDMVFKLNYFVNAKAHVRSVRVRQVVYATMKGTDITILELDTTFKQLVQEGFTPLNIDPVPASYGEPVKVIGVPGTGVKDSLRYLHKVVCEAGQSVNLKEDVYHWENSVRHRCSTVGGMSGSPMISVKTNRVVAIVNTGVNDDALAQPECSWNRPCEVSKNGRILTLPEENYAQRVSNIPSCFDKRGIFNLNIPSCSLEKPKGNVRDEVPPVRDTSSKRSLSNQNQKRF